MRVAVIGGGVAGIVTAKVLKEDGFEIAVFEKESTLGGVWAASNAYPGLRTNNPRETYVFSDFPHSRTTGDFPTATQVRAYLESYADHFGLTPYLHLETEVVSVSRLQAHGGGSAQGYRLATRSARDGGSVTTRDFDRVVICNGVFSEPYLPHFEGLEHFSGSVIHSSHAGREGSLQGRRVVVVGAGKSALDCATFASEQARSCTLVFRKPHWMLPRYFGQTRIDRVLFTRFAVTFLPPWYQMSFMARFFRWAATPLLPLRWLLETAFERYLIRKAGVPRQLIPEEPVRAGFENNGVGAEFFDRVRAEKAGLVRGEIASLRGGRKVRLSDGREIEADLIICATGWQQATPFLDAALESQIRQDGQFRLYRHILPAREPGLAFVGYASSGVSPLVSEIQAHWVSQYFRGELVLPKTKDIERSIDRILAWTARTFSTRKEGYFIGAHVPYYVDQLMRDMGLPTRRCKNPAEEYLGPFWSNRYRTVAEERRRLREGDTEQSNG